jgi:hypothetical protein
MERRLQFAHPLLWNVDVRFAAAGSTGRRNTGVKSLCWGFKLQGLAWSFVELTSHFVQIGLRVHRQVRALWKVLSQQAIGVLVRPALPRALRITKIDVDVGRQRKATMIRQFLAQVDCSLERKPPFNPDGVAKEFSDTIRSYGIASVLGDRYGGIWPRERFAAHGVDYQTASQSKSDLYLNLLPLLNSGRVEFLDHPRLTIQLCGLERRTARGGKDSIDHSPGAHDDVINAAAGSIVYASQRAAQAVPIVAPIIVGGPNATPDTSGLSTTELFYQYYNSGGGGRWP